MHGLHSLQSAWSAFQHDRGQVISGLRVTFLNKFRLGGGKAKVLITSTILKAKQPYLAIANVP